MGWFDEQIRERKEKDQQIYEETLKQIEESAITRKNIKQQDRQSSDSHTEYYNELIRITQNAVEKKDIFWVVVTVAVVTILGMVIPKISNHLLAIVIPTKNVNLLYAMATLGISVSISTALLNGAKYFLVERINIKVMDAIQSAMVERLLSLPVSFFRKYSSGNIAARVQYAENLCILLISGMLSTCLTAVFSIVYFIQIFQYTTVLLLPVVGALVGIIIISITVVKSQKKVSELELDYTAKESGISYALISGIQKIRITGSEKRAFAKWGSTYAQLANATYAPPLFIMVHKALILAITLMATVVIYYMAFVNSVTPADYYAFHIAYGMLVGAFTTLASNILVVADIEPILEAIKPVWDAKPEESQGKRENKELSGVIEIQNLSFRYHENMPYVLNDISLKIEAGQYVAIVGETGCGKSTLLRLLLGFELPEEGVVLYDGTDLKELDLKKLRQKIGVVLQDGKLFQGDIYSNIALAAPGISEKEVWKAAELAGIAEDIQHMPMGMRTLISEGSGGISGGQRQRILIARAIAAKPKILLFDEATSALDNLTQKRVADSLDELKCTRVVIAHRLSTIQHCDRILYLQEGRIVEDGTYQELLEKNGYFAKLVERQQLH